MLNRRLLCCGVFGLLLLAGCAEGPGDWVGDRVQVIYESGVPVPGKLQGYLLQYDAAGLIIEYDDEQIFIPHTGIKSISNLTQSRLIHESGSTETREGGSTESWESGSVEVWPTNDWESGSSEAGSSTVFGY
ncbi:hypothetical protein Pla110_10250 [Polystyrenella longa]|uniref:Uncharacterized protein n=1 Tax=Polystyrenella longa TaxID=2528007 RepID=A0A518CJD5_9PLAN|nr:hypothetical protein [Polystyrenella longa]QDU79317.1 hypothetical protein Pla110_10250 [Polystyrenella longa]